MVLPPREFNLQEEKEGRREGRKGGVDGKWSSEGEWVVSGSGGDGGLTEESEDEVLVTMRMRRGGKVRKKASSFLLLGGEELHNEAQVWLCLVVVGGV